MNIILNQGIIENVIEKTLRTYPEVNYKVLFSKSTASVYITLLYDQEEKTVRISNHNSNSNIKTLIIMKNTKTKSIQNFIINSIKELKIFSTHQKLKRISNDKKT